MRQLLVAREFRALFSVLTMLSPARALRVGRMRRGKVFRANSAPKYCSISSAGVERRAARSASGVTVRTIPAMLFT